MDANTKHNDTAAKFATTTKSALQDAIDRKPRGSSYYYAHEKMMRNNHAAGGGDLPAPSPPEGGTRLPTTTSTAAADDDVREAPVHSPNPNHRRPLKTAGSKKPSPYYYSKPKVTHEAPAPLPPEGGTLLASTPNRLSLSVTPR